MAAFFIFLRTYPINLDDLELTQNRIKIFNYFQFRAESVHFICKFFH